MAQQLAVLFVCLGNICRSPTAEGVFRARLRQAGLAHRVAVDSAGTAAWHAGKPPDLRTQAAARRRGYELSALRARQVDVDDFHRHDLVLAMDRNNLFALQQMAPANARARTGLLLDFARAPGNGEVPDPYYGDADGFDAVLDLVEDAADGLLQHLRGRLQP